jgi:colanic acid/amylovoran biosynthesis glycosyltransferase
MNDQSRPAAIIYTHSLLEGSCTFIKTHAEALTRHQAVYAGSHRIKGLELPADRTCVVNDGTPLGLAREAVFRSMGRAPALVKKLRGHNPGIVHAHFGTSGPAAMSLARALTVPLLVTFHGADATAIDEARPRSHRDRQLIKKKPEMIQRAGAFIAVSNYIRQRLLGQGYPDSKIILHRNGVDLDYFSPSEEIEREPIIVFVGRFVEKKGGEYLIEAARQMHESGVRFELVMIGGGPLEASLKTRASQSKIPCRFTGFLPVSEVRQWLNRAAVVAIPSVVASDGDTEGLPTIQLEAQAMGAPIVATRHSGIPEGVIEGVTAELVNERETRALAVALRSFLESRDKVREFGEAGRKFVAAQFDLRNQVSGLEDIYERLRAQ